MSSPHCFSLHITYPGSIHQSIAEKGSAGPQGAADRADAGSKESLVDVSHEVGATGDSPNNEIADGTTAANAFEALCLEDSDVEPASATSSPLISAADVYQALLNADSGASDSEGSSPSPSAGVVYAALMAEDSDDSMASAPASSPSVSARDVYQAMIDDSDDSMESAPASSPSVSARAIFDALQANDSDESIASAPPAGHSGPLASHGPWSGADFEAFRDPEEYL